MDTITVNTIAPTPTPHPQLTKKIPHTGQPSTVKAQTCLRQSFEEVTNPGLYWSNPPTPLQGNVEPIITPTAGVNVKFTTYCSPENMPANFAPVLTAARWSPQDLFFLASSVLGGCCVFPGWAGLTPLPIGTPDSRLQSVDSPACRYIRCSLLTAKPSVQLPVVTFHCGVCFCLGGFS